MHIYIFCFGLCLFQSGLPFNQTALGKTFCEFHAKDFQGSRPHATVPPLFVQTCRSLCHQPLRQCLPARPAPVLIPQRAHRGHRLPPLPRPLSRRGFDSRLSPGVRASTADKRSRDADVGAGTGTSHTENGLSRAVWTPGVGGKRVSSGVRGVYGGGVIPTKQQQDAHRDRAFINSDTTEPDKAPRGTRVNEIHRNRCGRERRKDQSRRQSQAQCHNGRRRFQATGVTCGVHTSKRPRGFLIRGLPGDLLRSSRR